jgi:hypothetical protein
MLLVNTIIKTSHIVPRKDWAIGSVLVAMPSAQKNTLQPKLQCVFYDLSI